MAPIHFRQLAQPFMHGTEYRTSRNHHSTLHMQAMTGVALKIEHDSMDWARLEQCSAGKQCIVLINITVVCFVPYTLQEYIAISETKLRFERGRDKRA